MNRIHGAFALIAVAAASLAVAQTPRQSMQPQQTTPQSQYPTESNPPAGTAQSDKAKKEQMKDCMAQQEANNSGMSKKEMKKYCKNQVDSAHPHS